MPYKFSTSENVEMCIYTITNNINNKVYIGKTTLSAKSRWSSHIYSAKKSNSYLAKALRLYGKDAFTFDIIDIAENKESLSSKEVFWIKHTNSMAPNGYNLTEGGEGTSGRIFSLETRQKISKAHLKMWGAEKSKVQIKAERTAKEIAQYDLDVCNRRRKSDAPICISVTEGDSAGCVGRIITRNDGVVFQSITSAAKRMNISIPSISGNLIGHNQTACTFQFRYGVHPSWEVVTKTRVVTQVNCSNGSVYKNIEAAAADAGVTKYFITKSIKSNGTVLIDELSYTQNRF